MKFVSRFAVVVVLLIMTSCSSATTTEHHVTRGGYLCTSTFFGSLACDPVSYTSGEALHLTVDFGVCLSSSCDHRGSTRCTASRSGSAIEVTAEGSWTSEDKGACTADCGILTATCDTDALPDGTYEVRYDQKTLTVTVPSTTRKTCTAGVHVGGYCCDTDADCPGSACSAQHGCQ